MRDELEMRRLAICLSQHEACGYSVGHRGGSNYEKHSIRQPLHKFAYLLCIVKLFISDISTDHDTPVLAKRICVNRSIWNAFAFQFFGNPLSLLLSETGFCPIDYNLIFHVADMAELLRQI